MIRTLSLKRNNYQLTLGSQMIELGQTTKIMGIINMTPDSFSQDGCLRKHIRMAPEQMALRLAHRHFKEGADILDIGGESSRPDAHRISVKEEIKRVIPAIKRIIKSVPCPVSIDTYKHAVIKHALDAGASIVNNIKGTQLSKRLLKMIKNYDATIVLMHMRGTPRTMQKDIHYNNIIIEIKDLLQKSIENCLESGIKLDRIIIDPGIGFGKTVNHNLNIIKDLHIFSTLKCPILVGTSRKSFIGKLLNLPAEQQKSRLFGSIATACVSILNGAHILRVHDVKETREAALITDRLL